MALAVLEKAVVTATQKDYGLSELAIASFTSPVSELYLSRFLS